MECFLLPHLRLTNIFFKGITLHFVVLSFDRYSRDEIIGEVFYSLGAREAVQLENQQMTLCKDIQPRSLKVKCDK